MIYLDHIIEDNIYKLSLKTVFEYITKDSVSDNSKSYEWLRYVSSEVTASEEEENTAEIEAFGDFMFSLKTNGSDFKIEDYYYAIPAMSYLLFKWLDYAKNDEKFSETQRIWEILHQITYHSIFFNLPSEPPFKP